MNMDAELVLDIVPFDTLRTRWEGCFVFSRIFFLLIVYVLLINASSPACSNKENFLIN